MTSQRQQAPNVAEVRKQRRWVSRLWGHPLVVVVLAALLWPCVAELLQNRGRSVVASKIIELFQPKPTATVAFARWIPPPDNAHIQTYTIWVPVDGEMQVIGTGMPELVRGLDDYGKGGEIWTVVRRETPGDGHWLIPWKFHARVEWKPKRYSTVIRFVDPTIKKRVVDCLVEHLGKTSPRAIEIAHYRDGMKEFTWWEWWPLVLNVVLIVLTTALVLSILRMPFRIARELQELTHLRRLSRGVCTKCCYDVSAIKAAGSVRTCPECGTMNLATDAG